jgi:hypothetical protein
MDSLTGRTIRWTFDDGPTAGITFDHVFHEDGTVTWTAVDGPFKGATRREKQFAAVRVNARTWVVSYLAASGHTLTVVLDLDDCRVTAFASNDESWDALQGRFEIRH